MGTRTCNCWVGLTISTTFYSQILGITGFLWSGKIWKSPGIWNSFFQSWKRHGKLQKYLRSWNSRGISYFSAKFCHFSFWWDIIFIFLSIENYLSFFPIWNKIMACFKISHEKWDSAHGKVNEMLWNFSQPNRLQEPCIKITSCSL